MTTCNLISFIFDIIKYVKRNKESYRNTVIKILGNSVRSFIRSEDIHDISLLIDNYSLISEFIELLKVTHILTDKQTIRNNNNSYEKINIKYKDKIYYVYIALKDTHFPGYDNNFILTCNNLSIDIEGNISTIYKHYDVNNYCSINWINSCFQDIINHTFRIILKIDMSHSFEKINYYNDICLNMINLGYQFDYENTKNLTSYQFIRLYNHTDISKFISNREVSESCSICREQYSIEPNKRTILMGCSHDFHMDCLHKWIKSDSNNTCPVCRNAVEFYI